MNYYGPHPSRYDEPEEPETPELQASETIKSWVKDPEPAPQPAVKISASSPVPGSSSPDAEDDELTTEMAARVRKELKDMMIREPLPPGAGDTNKKDMVSKKTSYI